MVQKSGIHQLSHGTFTYLIIGRVFSGFIYIRWLFEISEPSTVVPWMGGSLGIPYHPYIYMDIYGYIWTCIFIYLFFLYIYMDLFIYIYMDINMYGCIYIWLYNMVYLPTIYIYISFTIEKSTTCIGIYFNIP